MHNRKHDFGKQEIEEFLQNGLDGPNQLESPCENRFCAHPAFRAVFAKRATEPGKIELIGPSTTRRVVEFGGPLIQVHGLKSGSKADVLMPTQEGDIGSPMRSQRWRALLRWPNQMGTSLTTYTAT